MPFLISFEMTGYTLARPNSVRDQLSDAIVMAQVVTTDAKDIVTLERLRSIFDSTLQTLAILL